MLSLFQDVRYCLRSLAKTPGFTAVVILTLALGIGANTAIFSIVDAVLLRPLAFPEPDQLVKIVNEAPGVNVHDIGRSILELRDLRENSGVFQEVSAVWPIDGNITGAGQPQRAEAMAVSPNYFDLLGVKPHLGRLFDATDRVDGFTESAVISYDFWQRSFGGDPHVLGKRFREDGDGYTIVGVTPQGFRHPGRTIVSDVDMWAATGFAGDPFPHPPTRANTFIPGAIGRIKSGMNLQQAQARLDNFSAQLRTQYPEIYRPEAKFTIRLEPLKESVTGKVRPLLYTLLGAVAMMLLIGCVNIANLLLVRAAGRTREIAIRQSLGATRSRLIQQMLTESVLLALAAGVVGVVAATVSLRLLLRLVPERLPRLSEIGIDPRVLLFAFAVCLVTGILFGLAPAWQTSGLDLASPLKESGRGSGSSRRQHRTSTILVTAEFAICLMLMTGAGLLVRSFWRLTHIDPGFNPRNALVARIWLPQPNDPKQDPYARLQDRVGFIREVLRRVQSLPGVTSASMSTSFPMAARGVPNPVTQEGRDIPAGQSTLAESISVSPDYFKVLGAPLLTGRVFTDADQQGAAPVALVDRATAARLWPGESAIGKRLKPGAAQSRNPWFTVVGVVGDIRHDGVDVDGVNHVYYPVFQLGNKVLAVEARSAGNPGNLGELIRREIQAVDANLPIFGVTTFSEMLASSLGQHRFSAQLMVAFAVLALLLAAIGIYGVLAYFVGQRTREIGVRMALGASPESVVLMVMRQGMRPIIVGMVLGLAGSLTFSRLLARLVYGVSTVDPLVFVAVPAVLLVTACLASALPARRATRVDPLTALRYD